MTDARARSAEWQTLLLLAVITVPLMVVGAAVTATTWMQSSSAIALGDVKDAQIVEIRDRQNVTIVSGEFRSRVDAVGNTEKDAALLDRRGRTIIGEVEIEIPAPGRTDRRPELEVDVIGLRPNETFTVVIDDHPSGTFTTDDRGSADFEIQEGEAPAPLSGA
jgi:hypothetical protein